MPLPNLQLLVEVASGAGDVNAAGNSALPILYPLHNSGGLAAFGTIGALGRIHLGTVSGFGNLGHSSYSLHEETRILARLAIVAEPAGGQSREAPGDGRPWPLDFAAVLPH